jgi:hypothetical protein
VLSLAAVAQADSIVYDNLVNPLGNYLGGFAYEEAADDVELSGSGLFKAPPSLTPVSTSTATKPDPEPLSDERCAHAGSFGFNTPGDLLFSQTVPITATDGALIDFIDATPDVLLPGTVGVGLAFGGVDFDPTGAGSDAARSSFTRPGPATASTTTG